MCRLVLHERLAKTQNSSVMYYKKMIRELHRVKCEEVKVETVKQIGKVNDLRDQQLKQSLEIFNSSL